MVTWGVVVTLTGGRVWSEDLTDFHLQTLLLIHNYASLRGNLENYFIYFPYKPNYNYLRPEFSINAI